MSLRQCSPWNLKIEASQFLNIDLCHCFPAGGNRVKHTWLNDNDDDRDLLFCLLYRSQVLFKKTVHHCEYSHQTASNLGRSRLQKLIQYQVTRYQLLYQFKQERGSTRKYLLSSSFVWMVTACTWSPHMSVLTGPSSTLKAGLWGWFVAALIRVQIPPSKQAQMAN